MSKKDVVTPPKQFIGCHAHSSASVFDALGLPQEHIDFVLENGMDAWCLTDHGHQNGFAHAFLHSEKLKKAGRDFKFVGGVEAYYHPDLSQWRDDWVDAKQAKIDAKLKAKASDATEGNSEEEGSTVENEEDTKNVSKWFNPVNRRHHLVLLPKSRKGLENIFALVSRSYKEGFYKFPRIDHKMLKEHGEDIIVMSACVSGRALLQTDLGIKTLQEVVDDFNLGKKIRVLSYNEKKKKLEFKEVLAGEKTKSNSEVIKINLKNGKSVILTGDHEIFTDKGWHRVDELSSLMPVKILAFK